MLETNILINSCQVAVKHDTFEKFTELMNSLPKKPSEAAIFNNPNGTFIKLYHNKRFNTINVIYGRAIQNGLLGDPSAKFGKIASGFNGYNVIEFYFNFAMSISYKEESVYDVIANRINIMVMNHVIAVNTNLDRERMETERNRAPKDNRYTSTIQYLNNDNQIM